MATAEPARPTASHPRELQASVLAAFQLVEDARYYGTDRRSHRQRMRLMAERAVASRRRDRGPAPGGRPGPGVG